MLTWICIKHSVRQRGSHSVIRQRGGGTGIQQRRGLRGNTEEESESDVELDFERTDSTKGKSRSVRQRGSQIVRNRSTKITTKKKLDLDGRL